MKQNKQTSTTQSDRLPKKLDSKLVTLREKLDNTADLNVRNFYIGNVELSLVVYDGLVNQQLVAELVLDPLFRHSFSETCEAEDIYHYMQTGTVMALGMVDVYTYEELFRFLSAGFLALFVDGLSQAVVIGAQGFFFRSVSEPTSEMNEKASKEGFVEPVRINMTLLRRRIKSPTLKFEVLSAGTTSQTDLCLVYLTDIVSKDLLAQVKAQLATVHPDMVLTSGYLEPFLKSKRASLFTDVGTTERPDTLCAKIKEGRIGILIDGTPFALIVPYLFSEHFQTMDDYANPPFYAAFIRLLKYFCFALAILLPGLYVALGTFHPELFLQSLLFNIAAAQETTPFPLMIEAAVICFLYEIMREAGLRLPRAVGHAVSIVGSLVIGDAAVTAGLIGSPMVLVLTLTAIASFVVPSLQQPISILRFAYIFCGGLFGLYGIALLSGMLLCNVCALSAFGVPYTAPIAPFTLRAMRDTFVRIGFIKMQQYDAQIKDLDGVRVEEEKGGV